MGTMRHYNVSHEKMRRNDRGRVIRRTLFLWVLFLLLLSLPITFLVDMMQTKTNRNEAVRESGAPESILAPLPMQGNAQDMVKYGPVRLSDEEAVVLRYDSTKIRQQACGQVELKYFSDAAFLGDSLTEGLTEYKIELGGALVCGYVGIGPSSIVERATVTHPVRGAEIPLDVLSAALPKKLYILLGTNTLTTTGTEESFLKYYSAMIDELRSVLGDDCIIYVQSIPPVRPNVSVEKPGLSQENIRAVNERLAQLAVEKGCVYLELWEALADSDGWLDERYDAPDGIHLSAGNGYSAWIQYLRSHARYAATNEWIPGSVYAEQS